MGDEHQTGFQVVPICRTFVLLGSHHCAILIFHFWAIVCPRNRGCDYNRLLSKASLRGLGSSPSGVRRPGLCGLLGLI
jgi:hypothetical protein